MPRKAKAQTPKIIPNYQKPFSTPVMVVADKEIDTYTYEGDWNGEAVYHIGTSCNTIEDILNALEQIMGPSDILDHYLAHRPDELIEELRARSYYNTKDISKDTMDAIKVLDSIYIYSQYGNLAPLSTLAKHTVKQIASGKAKIMIEASPTVLKIVAPDLYSTYSQEKKKFDEQEKQKKLKKAESDKKKKEKELEKAKQLLKEEGLL